MASTTTMETASMGSTSKARPPAGRKASDVSAVIKPTERTGTSSSLKVRRRRAVEPRTSAARSVSVERIAMVEVAAVAEITVGEPVVTKIPAVGDPFMMIEECSTVMPVVPPVTPAPCKTSEEADSKSNTEGQSGAIPQNPGHRVPARVVNDGRPVDEPRIIGRHVDHLGVGEFDDDRVSLRRYLFIVVAVQVAGLLRLLTQRLDGIGHILRLGHICLAEGGGPG